jgi:hypothetical protein
MEHTRHLLRSEVEGSRQKRTRGSHTPQPAHGSPTARPPAVWRPLASRHRPALFTAGASDATASIGQGQPPVRRANQGPPRVP